MKRIALLCGCLLAGLSAGAQVTLDECRRLAREHYPEIRQYDLVRRTEEYTLSNARRAWLPQLSFAAQATWQTEVPSFPNALAGMLAQQGIDMPGMNKDQYKAALELNQTLWDGGKSEADKRIARAEAAEQARSTDVDLYALQGRVDNLFFGILLLDERIAQTRLTLDLLRSNLEKVRALQRNGVAMQSDADAVEAELLTVNQQLTQVTASRDSYRRMLEIFTGRPLDGERLERPDASEPRSMESSRPELALFDATADKLTAQERLVKAATRPRFGLFAQGYYGYPGMDYFQSMMSPDWSWNAMAGVKMSWNFGAYYTRKNSLAKLRTAKEQVEMQREIFLFNTRLQTAEESGDIARLRKALADDDRIVALRRSVREAAESKLRNGVIDTDDLLRKITDEAAAATARSAREIELLKTIYELKHTINR
ncbi:TolC family protein [Alistipes senegalensis]|uniref:TolC family protein n=1 Tax=Alistipes senegalensis JC50 TaxID=1033732 RepID=A0ABY5V820_9BACT|nr:TolC family protein [Alistipes senegalensis]UEA86627.1 TolC family protein [Alistipes senegalensis]UWN65785.1 TolC family protein [Alistipes senegalensis JC50]